VKTTTIPVITKYSDEFTEPTQRYLWVYAEEEDEDDVAFHHAPVLDWQSGLENLKQLHTEPIEQKPIVEEDEQEECECAAIAVVEIDNDTESEMNKIQETLKKLEIDDASDFLGRFLATKNPIYLKKAMKLTEEADPVSYYQLNKIAKKVENKKGKIKK